MQPLPHGQILPIMLGGPSLIFWVRGEARSPRPKGPRAGGVLGQGETQPPPHQLGYLGSAVSSPSAVRGGALTARRFSIILRGVRWPLLELVGGPCLGAMAPLNPPMPHRVNAAWRRTVEL